MPYYQSIREPSPDWHALNKVIGSLLPAADQTAQGVVFEDIALFFNAIFNGVLPGKLAVGVVDVTVVGSHDIAVIIIHLFNEPVKLVVGVQHVVTAGIIHPVERAVIIIGIAGELNRGTVL